MTNNQIKALFLDRDGVINEDKEYLFKINRFEFIPNIFELCNYFIKKDYKIFVITNQAGIARGYFTETDFNILTSWMVDQFLYNGIRISEVYFDPTHPKGRIEKYTMQSNNRKPNPGMIFQATEKYNIDLSRSVLVGDKDSDVLCGINAKVKRIYKLDSKRYKEDETIYNKKYESSIVIKVKELFEIINLEKNR